MNGLNVIKRLRTTAIVSCWQLSGSLWVNKANKKANKRFNNDIMGKLYSVNVFIMLILSLK